MKVAPVLAAAAAAAAAVQLAPVAAADVSVRYLGQPGELVNGNVTQQWTVSGLKPSSDDIPYRPVGTLWEATATDEAVAGSVVPIVSNLNARAHNGDTYRVLFGVATSQGVNPSTLPQGEKVTGKLYFDVTGQVPDSIFYSSGGPEELLWVQAPPAPVQPGTGRTPSSSTAPGASGAGPVATTPTAVLPNGQAAPNPVSASPAGNPGPPPALSSGTPVPAGSAGTPLTERAPTGPTPGPAAPPPAPVAPSSAGSAGTPLPVGDGAATAPVSPGATPTQVPAASAPTTSITAPPPA